MISERARKRRWFLAGALSLILTGIVFAWYRLLIKTLVIRVFTSRDIDRALGWLHGNPTFFGPELSGGGVLPGPFAYFILCVPLLKGVDWRLLVYWEIALAAIGVLLLFWFVRRSFGSIAAVTVFALFLASRHMNTLMKQIVTSNFVIPFDVFCLLGLIYVFSEAQGERRRRVWYATCLACALGVQLQMTAVYHAIAAVFLQLLSKRFQLNPLTREEWRRGIAIFLLPFVPFLAWFVAVQAGLTAAPRSLEAAGAFWGPRIPQLLRNLQKIEVAPEAYHFGDFTRGLWELQFAHNYLFTYLFWISIALTAAALIFRRARLIAVLRGICFGSARQEKALRVILFVFTVFGAISLPWVLKRMGPFRYMLCFELTAFVLLAAWNAKLVRILGRRSLGLFCVAALAAQTLGLEPFCWIGSWLSIVGPLSAAVLAMLVAGGILLGVAFGAPGKKIAQAGALVVVVGFCCAFLVGVYVNRVEENWIYHDDSRKERSRELPAEDLEEALNSVYRETGWTYEEARQRLFRVRVKHSADFSVIYPAVARDSRSLAFHSANSPDGYFVFRKQENERIEDPTLWLKGQRLPPEIRIGIQKGTLIFGKPELFGAVGLIPYTVRDPFAIPRFFQNIGFSYDREPEEKLLSGLTAPTGSSKLGDQDYLFYWNFCGGSEVCRFGFRLTVLKHAENVLETQVRVFGSPLSKSSFWYSPAWTQRVVAPSISVTCGGKSDTEIVASSIGYRSRKYSDTFLAPFERKIRFRCEGTLTKITAGFKSSWAHTTQDLSNRPVRVSDVSEISRAP